MERFNRSLQEGFIDYREDELREGIEGFNRKLMEYLIWYNTERIYSGIEGKAHLRYFCDKFFKNSTDYNIVWTYT